jgi:TolB-like protein/Flp pilus assembly protein TadD/predicted Ser/Thr protein kinase
MLRVIRICRKCGAKIFSDAPEGLCARCVLKTALGTFPKAAVAGVVDPGSPDELSAPNASPPPDNKTSTRAAELLGELGDYELLEEIGRGGQGVVFRARQKSLNRTVAVKVISLGQWASKTHLKRFRLEAEAAARLEHPGIVPIHEVGERDGSCYFSMKFIEGGQLDEVVKQTPMPIRQAVELIAKVARTVHYAHEHGILHRDIKPGNILLDTKGEPHLTDFGLARLVESESSVTHTLEVLGTPSYMAPEQAVGNNTAVSSATDVYGLGAVLYQLLTGHPPFAGGTTYETIKLLLDTEPRQPRLLNPKIDRDLSTICLKCLDKDPQRRYTSALALAEDLERWLKHEPIQARHTGVFARGKKWVRRNPTSALLAACLIALVAAAGWIISKSEFVRHPVTTGIAVLPFENLSEQKGDGAFVDGVQDDILTKLAKIADLKVISRTSVMEYRGRQNVRQIGDALRVSHVLEGSARRNGNRIRLNAQLIDTRTDAHVWAEQYDRDLNDLFAIQAEIAQKVAEQLHTKMSAAEKVAIQRKPTVDLAAFDLYSRANQILLGRNSPVEDFGQAVDLLNQAVARDPSFLEAYCQLAFAHDAIYFNDVDRTPARLTLASTAIQAAFRVHPGAGEAHLAQAEHLYRGYKDYDGALAELEVARQTLPNHGRIFQLMAYIHRRQGRWEEAAANLQHAAELDPRDVDTLTGVSEIHERLGRIAEAKSWLDRAIAVAQPDDVFMKLALPNWEFNINADPRPLHQAIQSIRATNPAALKSTLVPWFLCALAERDAAAARESLSMIDGKEIGLGQQLLGQHVSCPRGFFEGLIARMANDEHKAQLAFTTARAEQEKVVLAHPDFGPAWCALGIIDAGLGRKEDALREGRRAIELFPMERDAIVGRILVRLFAVNAAWVGEKDLACEQLTKLLGPPRFLQYGDLKLMPSWDPLRGDPRFEKIVASLAPKETVNR